MIRVAIGAGFALAALCVSVILLYPESFSRWTLGAGYLVFCGVLVLHAHAIVAFKVLTRNGALSENVVLVGATPNARRVAAAHVIFNGITGFVALLTIALIYAVTRV